MVGEGEEEGGGRGGGGRGGGACLYPSHKTTRQHKVNTCCG